ncbi:MAG: nucleotidyltransferase family protein [Candidatus Berkelbacteria bacterium]|nr:MAG: nucleotidyltransferase family protein [Candidatus Berkelbacteria bacterium]QQG51519.1 MAG: nucleotidyltransferase family protein [Candidatus Berkelbacteria bacterium]
MKNAHAIILAGGKRLPDLESYCGVSHVANIPVNGVRMVERVASAFRDAGVQKITVVGAKVADCQEAAAGLSLLGSLKNGLDLADYSDRVILSTCDMPFLEAKEVSEFLSRQNGSTLYCAVVPVAACRDKYPELSRTSLTTAEGEFTLGNIFSGEKWVWDTVLPFVERAYKARKNKLRLAWMLGPFIAVRYLRARTKPEVLRISDLEHRARKLAKCPVSAVIGDWPGIGTDIDSTAHFQAAEPYFPQLVSVRTL